MPHFVIQQEESNCILTGCTVLIRNEDSIVAIHGDLKYTYNFIRGTIFLFLDGIGRSKDGKMHCMTFSPDVKDPPEAHIQVIGDIVPHGVSDTGYGRITFHVRTLFVGDRVLENIAKYHPDRMVQLLRQYSLPTPPSLHHHH